ncbi:MAG: efflux RND transporter periplasmic adaptor subunit [Muribaculaceae bacterium]
MKKKTKLLCGLMLTSILTLCVSCKERQSSPMGGDYKILHITLSDRTLYSDLPASIQGKQDVQIYPQISGLITRVCINEGANVKKGQTLFVIDQTPYKAALEKAKANVESAEANVSTAKMTVDSKEKLFEENVISDFDLQQARNTLRSANAALAQAQAELTSARNNLTYTEIKSPVDGTAGMSVYRIGALVSPSITTPLVSVSDNVDIYAYFSMTEKQILALVRPKGALYDMLETMPEVELILSDGSLYPEKGKINAISGIIDRSTGAVTLRAIFPNANHILRSGGTGTIRIPYEKKDCIVIPQTATYELQDKVYVYKVVDGKTKSTQITVFGINNGNEYIVESGLNKGDVIIAEGAGLLRDGMTVGNVAAANVNREK